MEVILTLNACFRVTGFGATLNSDSLSLSEPKAVGVAAEGGEAPNRCKRPSRSGRLEVSVWTNGCFQTNLRVSIGKTHVEFAIRGMKLDR